MNLLLDPHTFLWFIEGSSNLSNLAKHSIENPNNTKFISIASIWEISIKVSIGKLELAMSITELLESQVYDNAIELLPIRSKHLDKLVELPFHHKDPFDRLIISQSLSERMPIISKDQLFDLYPVELFW